jgi:hypothetical protein
MDAVEIVVALCKNKERTFEISPSREEGQE